MTNVEALTPWPESTDDGVAGYQDYNNVAGEYSLPDFDARQSLVIRNGYPLPIGCAQLFIPHLSGITHGLIGGWGLEGITNFHEGIAMSLSVSPNIISAYAFDGTERPNVVAGCGKTQSGSMYDRLG